MSLKSITSSQNSTIKLIKRLGDDSRYCRKEARAVAEGIHLASELIKHPQIIEKICVRGDSVKNSEISNLLEKFDSMGIDIVEVPVALFNEIAPVSTSQGIMVLIKTPAFSTELGLCDVVYLDGVQDPGNIGTIIRASVASGVNTIALSNSCAYVWSAKVIRAAMGAHFSCKFVLDKSLEEIKEMTLAQCLIADIRDAEDLFTSQWGQGKTIWVFGSEGAGISESVKASADKRLFIPIEKSVESLNVAMAATVCLFEQRRRRLLK